MPEMNKSSEMNKSLPVWRLRMGGNDPMASFADNFNRVNNDLAEQTWKLPPGIRREYAVHDQEGRSRGSSPYPYTEDEQEALEMCREEVERLRQHWADVSENEDTFHVVTRLVSDWEPVI
jgi:cell wall assembly regulator SMI1